MTTPRLLTATRRLTAVIATVTGAYATVVIPVLIPAAAPNGGEAKTRMFERMAIGVAALGAAAALGALCMMVRGGTRPAAWVDLIPPPVCAVPPAAWLASQG